MRLRLSNLLYLPDGLPATCTSAIASLMERFPPDLGAEVRQGEVLEAAKSTKRLEKA